MQRHDFGKIGISFEQDYSSTKPYTKNSYVRYENSLWISKQDTQGNELTVESDYWQKLGEDSIVGVQGYMQSVVITIKATNWTKDGDNARYKYNLGQDLNIALLDEYDGKDFIVCADETSITSEQLTAIISAQIEGCSDSYIYAYGVVPSVDFPVIVYYF